MSKKPSKLTQKPIFKSRKKANLRLSHQNNKISNYFTGKVAAIGQGMGGVESESQLSDLINRFSPTRTPRQPGPR